MNTPYFAARARRARLLAAVALPAAALLATPAHATTPVAVEAVPTIADMVALGSSSSSTPYLVVAGAQGGVFVWNGAGAATTDNCTTFAATGVGTGRWERQNYAAQDAIPVSWCDTLAHADAAAVAQAKSLYVDQAVTLAANTTLSARRITGQEKIALGGFTLAINGFYDPAPYQVFNASDAASLTFRKPPTMWTGENFGAAGDGTTDDSAADNAGLLMLRNEHGGNFVWRPNRVYKHAAQVAFDMSAGQCSTAPHYYCSPLITGFGAAVTTSGAFTALDIVGGDLNAGSTIEGVTFDMNPNNSQIAAVRGIATAHGHWENNDIICNTGGIGFELENSTTPTITPDNGSFLNTLAFNNISSIGHACAAGVMSLGDSNATNLLYNTISDSTIGVEVMYENATAGGALLPAGFNVEGNTFEGDPTAVSVIGANGEAAPAGLSVVNNWVDSGDTTAFFNYNSATGGMLDPAVFPVVWMNRDEGGGATIIGNSGVTPFAPLRADTCSPLWSGPAPKCTIYSNQGGSFINGNNSYDMPNLPVTNPGAGHGWYYDSTTHAVTEGH
ncbi:MAG TPA: hypothetical protein VG387_03440 [Rhizomicrobium sp.]|jgi:hypothetical protein|nr:hypothetical protein [Rhizomicrobium sp.]